MPAPARWNVLPHDSIAKLADNLWTVEGDLPANMPMRRRMTVVRLGGGRLLIHNAIALQDDAMRQIEAWGAPAVLVVPNGWHRIDAPAYCERYPEIRVYCPRAARERVSQVVTVTGHYDAMPADERVRVEPLTGMRNGEAAFVIHSGSGEASLLLNDVVFNLTHMPGLRGMMLRLLGSSGGPRVTPIARLLTVNDRGALRKHLQQLADEPRLVRVLVSHGAVMDQAPRAALLRAAATL